MSIDIEKFKAKAQLKDRYQKQLARLHTAGVPTPCIETAVDQAVTKLAAANTSMVIYGDPQSGKTEMMICLTAKLLDSGHRVIVHLMNDSVDLLGQNLKRFKHSGLAPAPKTSAEFMQSPTLEANQELVVFCKKNPKDLEKLIDRLKAAGEVVVVDDEADYATPNAKVNLQTKTRINELIGTLIGSSGHYVGVTATPARLDLNNTFNNDTDKWVKFPSHAHYTGPDTFFPIGATTLPYRRVSLDPADTNASRSALVRFLVTVGYLNSYVNATEENYSMLVHTSGKKEIHTHDRVEIEKAVKILMNPDHDEFPVIINDLHAAASHLYSSVDADKLVSYVVENASRATFVVLNSDKKNKVTTDNPTVPLSPFTVVVGGNIVSRGVTFPNLLSMYFARTVKHKLQQDTYIQRARMFGARGAYLEHFELTIPDPLYDDWHRCFVFHRLALATVNEGMGSPVWIGDGRVSVAAASSVDRATVAFDRGEMSFAIFDYSDEVDKLIQADQTSPVTLKSLQALIGKSALPDFLIQYIETVVASDPAALAIHTTTSIETYGTSANKETISRDKGFIGKSQLEVKKFPSATHHVKVFNNADGKAKLFYKQISSFTTLHNTKKATTD
jgi:hypothetical protein